MARKIRLVGTALCILVFLCAIVAVCITGSVSVDNVKKSSVVEVFDESINIEWKPVSNADGYEVYTKSANEKDYTLALKVGDKKASKATVDGLVPYVKYDAYIVGYRGAENKKHISRKASAFSFETLPKSPEIIVDSVDKGELKIEWEKIDNCAGYEVYYKGGDDEDTQIISDTSTTNLDMKNKTVNTQYSVKARSFVYKNEEKIYSPWSKEKKIKIAELRVQSNTIDPTKPMIALTFDDGPDYKNSSKRILDTLEKYNAKATFFMVGQNAAKNKDNLKRKVELGMEIGNHTYDHNHYGKNVTAQDISKASDAIYKACGVKPTAFRSPGGNTTSTIREECKAEGMPLYYWNLDTQDWKSRDADKVYRVVMKYAEDGDIVLMHEIYDSTADAVEKMVPALIKQGYQLVTCEDLVKYKGGAEPKAGTQYVNAHTVRNKTS